MRSRNRDIKKISSKQSIRSTQSKSTGRSVPERSNKSKDRSGRSVPRTSSKTDSSKAKRRNRSVIPKTPSSSKISKKKSKDSLIPSKKSSQKKIVLQNDPCGTGPDFYTNVLGPTADETILVGLETFMKFCQDCSDKYEDNLLVDSGTGLSTRISSESIVERCPSHSTHSSEKEESEKSSPKSSLKSNSSKVASTSQIAPLHVSVSERAEISYTNPGNSEPEDDNVGEETEQNPEKEEEQNPEEEEEQTGNNTEEFFDNISQVSTSSKIGGSKIIEPEKHSSELRTNSALSAQQSQTERPELKHDDCQTISTSETCSSQTSEYWISNAQSQTKQPSVKSMGSHGKLFKTSETQVISTPHINKSEQSVARKSERSPEESMQTTYDSSSNSSRLKDSVNSNFYTCPCKRDGDTTSSDNAEKVLKNTIYSVPLKPCQKPFSTRSCLKSPKCKCNSVAAVSSKGSFAQTPPKKHVRVCCACDKPTSGIPTDAKETFEPSQKGDTNEEASKVRYAITKITKFYSYTTFEVMRSTRKKPRVMPKSLEGVFVLRNTSINKSLSEIV